MQADWNAENDMFRYKDILGANTAPYFLPQGKDLRPSSPDQNSTDMYRVQDFKGQPKEMAPFFFFYPIAKDIFNHCLCQRGKERGHFCES